MSKIFKPGDRVMQKEAFDPLTRYRSRYGGKRDIGTVDQEQTFPDMILVTWDKTDETGATVPGACAPMPPDELEHVNEPAPGHDS